MRWCEKKKLYQGDRRSFNITLIQLPVSGLEFLARKICDECLTDFPNLEVTIFRRGDRSLFLFHANVHLEVMTTINEAIRRITETKKSNGVSKPKLTRTSTKLAATKPPPELSYEEEDLPSTQPVDLDAEESPSLPAATTSSFKSPRKTSLLSEETLEADDDALCNDPYSSPLAITCTSCSRTHAIDWPSHLYAPRIECKCPTCHTTPLTCIATLLPTPTSGGRKRKARD